MTKRYFIDTCIWRDFFEDRFSKTNRPIGGYANKLFQKIIKERQIVFYSPLIIKELNLRYNLSEIEIMLNILYKIGLLQKIVPTNNEIIEAEKLSIQRNIPFVDCLNAIQARNNDLIMVTQDKHYFEKLFDFTRSKRPEDLI